MLFIDGACIQPYSGHTLLTQPMGGSEASVVRVAQRLKGAVVMQHNRPAPEEFAGVSYRPLDGAGIPATGSIVVFRNAALSIQVARQSPQARVYLWLEDLADLQLALGGMHFAAFGVELIAVSHYHRRQILDTMIALAADAPLPKVHVIYNPVDDDLVPRGDGYDPDRLVFISSPHKGLRETLGLFQALKARHPRLRLQIANPGYHPTPDLTEAGVEVIGALPHAQVIAALRGAFCLFYANVSYPETFGVVYAEANAVGVPVLCHPFGAAPEVVSSPGQLVDCRDPEAVIARFEAWRDGGRPKVAVREELRLSSVMAQWGEVAEGRL